MPPRRYIDFKLYLARGGGTPGTLSVSVLPTAEVGETVTPVVVPAERWPKPGAIARIDGKTATLRELVDVGKQLADCLLPAGVVRELFARAMKLAGTDGGVRLRLVLADHALKAWPWEYTYLDLLGGPDEGMRGFLALDPRVSFVRHEPLAMPHPAERADAHGAAQPAAGALRMLVATALPAERPTLDLEPEIASLTGAVRDLEVSDTRVELAPVIRDATRDALAAALRGAGAAQIFHFAGHGETRTRNDPLADGGVRKEGVLLLVADAASRREAPIAAADLGRLLAPAGVRLAVLSACETGARSAAHPWDGVAGALAASGIAAVVAMRSEVMDDAALEFARAFYGAVAAGLSLDEAMSAGRLAMLWAAPDDGGGGATDVEWGVPVLYSRLPDGRLFPERMAAAGATAEEFRKAIRQTVDTIEADGTVTGVRVKRVGGSVLVEQKVGIVRGSLTGIATTTIDASAPVAVRQDLGRVEGDVTGVVADEI